MNVNDKTAMPTHVEQVMAKAKAYSDAYADVCRVRNELDALDKKRSTLQTYLVEANDKTSKIAKQLKELL